MRDLPEVFSTSEAVAKRIASVNFFAVLRRVADPSQIRRRSVAELSQKSRAATFNVALEWALGKLDFAKSFCYRPQARGEDVQENNRRRRKYLHS